MPKREIVFCLAVFLLGLTMLGSKRDSISNVLTWQSLVERPVDTRTVAPSEAQKAMQWRRLAWLDENGRVEPGGLARAARQRRQNIAHWQAQSRFDPVGFGRSSWMSRGPQNVGGRTRSLIIHPSNPNTMWAGSVSGGIWKTTDGGMTWAPLDDFMANLSATSLAIDPMNPDVLYCGTGEGFTAADAIQGDGIFKTTDGGATWNQLGSTATWATDSSGRVAVDRIAIAPANGKLILAGTESGGIQRSTDSGATWTTTRQARGCFDLAFNPGDSSKAVAGVVDGDDTNEFHSALYSTDGGATWRESNLKDVQAVLPGGWVAGFRSRIELCYAPSSPNIVYASVYTNLGISCGSPPCASLGSIWRSTDGGVTYSRTTDDSYCYGESQGMHIVRSSDHGQTCSLITNGLSDVGGGAAFIAPLILDPNNSNTMLAGGVSLWRSNDVRSALMPTWSAISPSSLGGSVISAVAVAPGNSNIIWVAYQNGVVYKTGNGLSSEPAWTPVDDNGPHNPLPDRFITRIGIDPANSNIVYLALGGYTSGNLQKTTDGGITWVRLTGTGPTGLPFAPIRGIARDPSNADALYAGTEVRVFSSVDGGSTWSAASQGPANVPIDELVFLSNSSILLAATHGRGLWTTDVSGTGTSCVYHLGSSSASFTSVGGTANVSISTSALCPWQAASSDPWLTVAQPQFGGGDATIIYSVAANTDAGSRSGVMTVAGQTFTVTQSGAPTISSVSSAGKNLLVTGLNFDGGAVVLVNGVPQPTLYDEAPQTLIGKKSVKRIGHGEGVSVWVRNSDGAISNIVGFTRP